MHLLYQQNEAVRTEHFDIEISCGEEVREANGCWLEATIGDVSIRNINSLGSMRRSIYDLWPGTFNYSETVICAEIISREGSPKVPDFRYQYQRLSLIRV